MTAVDTKKLIESGTYGTLNLLTNQVWNSGNNERSRVTIVKGFIDIIGLAGGSLDSQTDQVRQDTDTSDKDTRTREQAAETAKISTDKFIEQQKQIQTESEQKMKDAMAKITEMDKKKADLQAAYDAKKQEMNEKIEFLNSGKEADKDGKKRSEVLKEIKGLNADMSSIAGMSVELADAYQDGCSQVSQIHQEIDTQLAQMKQDAQTRNTQLAQEVTQINGTTAKNTQVSSDGVSLVQKAEAAEAKETLTSVVGVGGADAGEVDEAKHVGSDGETKGIGNAQKTTFLSTQMNTILQNLPNMITEIANSLNQNVAESSPTLDLAQASSENLTDSGENLTEASEKCDDYVDTALEDDKTETDGNDSDDKTGKGQKDGSNFFEEYRKELDGISIG